MSEHTSSRPSNPLAGDDADAPSIDAETKRDEAHRALSADRRRRVLSALEGESAPIDAGTLARWVTVEEACETSDMVTAESIKQVHVSLHHHHLPKLADLGLITYDPEERTVEETANGIDPARI